MESGSFLVRKRQGETIFIELYFFCIYSILFAGKMRSQLKPEFPY